ncbi:hypothetical protein BGZ91_001181 [Linnemannia elongata]|nr:hypothetical protein BGZ91_001181 [Linnemannia elongata]
MIKSAFLLTLALVASVAKATDPPKAFTLDFWTDAYKQGTRVSCIKLEYDNCYRLPIGGLSSAEFKNYNLLANTFAITLYSGNGCNIAMDRWGFHRSNFDGPYTINYFQTLNDNVSSFKIANRDLPTTHGYAQPNEERTTRATCIVG